jgi:O-antigen ligase
VLLLALAYFAYSVTSILVTDNTTSLGLSDAGLASSSIINRTLLLVFLITAIVLALRPGSITRAGRLFKSPIVFVFAYQAILAFHFARERDYFDLGKYSASWLLLVLGLTMSPQMPADLFVRRTATVLRCILWLSVAAAVLRPQSAFELNDTMSFVPGMTSRLAGVCRFANLMGGVAAIAILFEMHILLRRRLAVSWAGFYLIMALCELILSQSKTGLIAGAVGAAYLFANRTGTRTSKIVNRLVFAIATVGVLGMGWLVAQPWVRENQAMVSTLTGRTELWRFYLDLAWESPVIGHGLGLWATLRDDPTFVYKWAAGNAHNQLLNSFLLAGMVGLSLWFLYVAGLFRASQRVAPEIRPLYLALLILLLARCLTESGLEPGEMSQIGFFQMVLYGMSSCYSGIGAKAHRPNPGNRLVGSHPASPAVGSAIWRRRWQPS